VVTPTVGGGSTFAVELPSSEPEDEESTRAVDKPRRGGLVGRGWGDGDRAIADTPSLVIRTPTCQLTC
jgi:hypothetical protein